MENPPFFDSEDGRQALQQLREEAQRPTPALISPPLTTSLDEPDRQPSAQPMAALHRKPAEFSGLSGPAEVALPTQV